MYIWLGLLSALIYLTVTILYIFFYKFKLSTYRITIVSMLIRQPEHGSCNVLLQAIDIYF